MMSNAVLFDAMYDDNETQKKIIYHLHWKASSFWYVFFFIIIIFIYIKVCYYIWGTMSVWKRK